MADRIDDIYALVRETRDDVKVVRKTLFGNGTGPGVVENLRVVTHIVDEHINEHDERTANSRALRRGVTNRVFNVIERTVPWAALLGLLATRVSG